MDFSAEFSNPALQKKIHDAIEADYLGDVEVEITVSVKLATVGVGFEEDQVKEILADLIKDEYGLMTVNMEAD